VRGEQPQAVVGDNSSSHDMDAAGTNDRVLPRVWTLRAKAVRENRRRFPCVMGFSAVLRRLAADADFEPKAGTIVCVGCPCLLP
jgi:hypothetical protein